MALALVIVQQINLRSVETLLRESRRVQSEFQHYSIQTFNLQNSIEQRHAIETCMSLQQDSSLVAFIPRGLCRACFTSLLMALHDSNFPSTNILIVNDGNDVEVKSECVSRGFRYMSINLGLDNLGDIVLTRKYRGVLPIYMLYDQGRDSVLKTFISDDERLFGSLVGMD